MPPPVERIRIVTSEDLVGLRRCVRQAAIAMGFGPTDQVRLVTAASELARNIVLYAERGEVVLRLIREEGRDGILVSAQDEGPGIEDPALALQDHFSTGQGSGLGLPGARRLMDEFELESGPSGTTVTMRKWASRRA